MKIAFFGTSDRSIPILEALNKNFALNLCITKSDVKIGRKHEPRETFVKQWAKKNSVDYLEIASLQKEQDKVITEIKQKDIELGVMADFSFIVSKKLITAIPKGIINIHFSMLPKYRGASPVQFALLKGDKTTGITCFHMNGTMDTGDILWQYEYKIGDDDTAESLYSALFFKAAENISAVIKNYALGKITPLPQDESQATYTYSRSHPDKTVIFKEDAKINWDWPDHEIERLIRAYYPWPIAWTTLNDLAGRLDLILKKSNTNDLLVKLHKARIQNGHLLIEKLQVEGKKVISWEEFKNGYLETSS